MKLLKVDKIARMLRLLCFSVDQCRAALAQLDGKYMTPASVARLIGMMVAAEGHASQVRTLSRCTLNFTCLSAARK